MRTTHFWGLVQPWLGRMMAVAGSILLTETVSVQAAYSLPVLSRLPIMFEGSFEPPGDGAPDQTTGAGSRTGTACPGDDAPVTVLMPDQHYGLTLQRRPSIFVEMQPTTADQVLVAFRNEAGTHHGRSFFPITAETGLVEFTLPAMVAPLAVGTNYQWSFVLVCGETVQPDDPVITGWVQRVDPNLIADDIQHLNQDEQVQWYAQNGYWYDLMAALYAEKRDR